MAEPPITIQAAHYSGSNGTIYRIVIHATSPSMKGHESSKPGMARSTAQYFASPSSGGSAHYIVDSGKDEQHCVRDNIIAWHAPPNGHSIGIEICGEASYQRYDWLADEVYQGIVAAAERTIELCERHGVPKQQVDVSELKAGHRGICGHVDVAKAFGESDHWDPGPNFPWDYFMELVTGGSIGSGEIGEDWYDAMKDSDVVGEIKVSDRAYYQLQKDGGIRVVGANRKGIDNEPFHEYYIVANDGSAYTFGPNKNGGVFSYPGLPENARQGNRFFTSIHQGE